MTDRVRQVREADIAQLAKTSPQLRETLKEQLTKKFINGIISQNDYRLAMNELERMDKIDIVIGQQRKRKVKAKQHAILKHK